jgi:pimeloyl-ACP methyl ester carboxylesterase
MRIVAPDLNIPSFQRLDFKAMARVSFWEAKKHLPAVVVGSSLGALVALELARIAPPAALVLIAPALGFGSGWIDTLPKSSNPPAGDSVSVFHHGEMREMPIHARFFEDMARLDLESAPPPIPAVLIMGDCDESVPIDGVRSVWTAWEKSGRLPPGSKFVEIAGGDHGLVDHVGRIADEIVAADASRIAAGRR